MSTRSSIASVAATAVLISIAASILFGHRTLLPDEIRPLIITQRSIGYLLQFIRADIVQTPVFPFTARAWFAGLGPTDTAAKVLVATITGAALVAFVILASRLTRHYWLAATIALLFYLRIGSSLTLVRMYGLMLLFVILGLLAWDRWIRTGGWQAAAVWVGAMALAVNTHASAGLLLPAFVVASWPTSRRWAAVGLAAIAAFALIPWIAFVLPEIRRRGLAANVGVLVTDPWRATLRIPFEILSGEDPGGASPKRVLEQLAAHYPLRAIAVALFAAIGGGWLIDRRRGKPTPPQASLPDHWPRFLVAAVLLPPALLLGLSLVWRPVISTRYVLASLPAYWLLLAWLATGASRRLTRALAAAAVAWIALSAGVTWRVHRSPSRARSTVDYVSSHWRPGDLLLLGNHSPLGYQVYWEWNWRLHDPGRLVTLEPDPWVTPWVRDVLPHDTLSPAIFENTDRIWLVTAFPKRRQALREALPGYGWAPIDNDFGWDGLSLYERVPPAAPTRPR